MHEPTVPTSGTRRGILIWAVTATSAALVFGNAALLFFMKWRVAEQKFERLTAQTQGLPANSPLTSRSRSQAASAASPFATLQDSDVVGRYRLFQEGVEVGIVQLLENHSMINKDGTTFPQYRWEIQPNRLMTRWQSGHIYFDVMPRPGVFVARTKDNDDYRRLEKVEE